MAGGDAGGIVRAAALLGEHGGAIEADLQRYYGLHVGDFPWPLTARRLDVLLRNLPEESELHQRLLPPEARGWSLQAHLAAATVDELRMLQYQRAVISGAKGIKRPEPIPRPGVGKQHARRRVDRAKAAAALEARGITIPDELRGR